MKKHCLYPVTLEEKFLFSSHLFSTFIYLFICVHMCYGAHVESEDNPGSQVFSSIMWAHKTELKAVRLGSRWAILLAYMHVS